MGQSTHVAVFQTIIMLPTEPTLRHRRHDATPGAEFRIQEPTMTSDTYNRRHTDRGYIAQFPTTLAALRSALGWVPVSEALGSLSHWRRRRDSQADNAGN
jgi:hypothetical protein